MRLCRFRLQVGRACQSARNLSIRPQPSGYPAQPAQMLGHARRGDTRGAATREARRKTGAGARAALRGQMQGHADAGAHEARRAREAHQQHVSFRRRCMLRRAKHGEGRCRGMRGAARALEGMRCAATRQGPARTARAGNRALSAWVVSTHELV
jgi:hypothetical protein